MKMFGDAGLLIAGLVGWAAGVVLAVAASSYLAPDAGALTALTLGGGCGVVGWVLGATYYVKWRSQ